MKTFNPTLADIDRQWYLVDAEDQILGRLASQIAHRLRGKHKPEFAPHVDNGDFVVVINCEKIRVTGTKLQDKRYYSHSDWVGGMPISSAFRKSSSVWLASSSPAAKAASWAAKRARWSMGSFSSE